MSEKLDNLKQLRVESLLADSRYQFVRFKGAPLVSAPVTENQPGTEGLVAMTEDNFSPIAYEFKPSPSRAAIMDMFHMIEYTAPDWSHLDRYVAFGDKVWDRQTLTFAPNQMKWVYATNIKLSDNTAPAKKFLLELSQGDADLAHDYLQAMAPLMMMDRPTGIIWFVGDGANGKSSLLKALYKVFGRHFVSLTTADLEDGRDIPSLRGKLGNIVLEASEARIADSKAYKSIGSHENLRVHAFNKQSGIEIESGFHTIFNANNIPTFADKTGAIKRRTWTIPFNAHFKDNPTFERDTFTPEFLGGLFQLILDTAVEIRDNGNKYQWSPATMDMKKQYDDSVNSAEAFIKHLIDLHIMGVYNYAFLESNYRDWCSREGHIPLSIQTLKRTLNSTVGANSKVVHEGGKSYRRILFNEAFEAGDDLVWEDGSGYGVATPKKPVLVENQKLSGGW
jgi:phage/plasmid-associated DNA primase